MNIFCLDTDPVRAAQYHNDSHVVKMVLETAQILSTALLRHCDQTAPRSLAAGTYKPTHKGRLCVLWAGETQGNFRWLAELGLALVEEHVLRFQPKRRHKSEVVIRHCLAHIDCLPPGPLQPFSQDIPERFHGPCGVEAMRRYYIAEKQELAQWRDPRDAPSWWPL